jgi:hypothetical protein
VIGESRVDACSFSLYVFYLDLVFVPIRQQQLKLLDCVGFNEESSNSLQPNDNTSQVPEVKIGRAVNSGDSDRMQLWPEESIVSFDVEASFSSFRLANL